MNMLNALIIEGNVTRGLSTYEDKGDFGIEVIRNYKNRNNEIVEEKSYFDVELYGNMLKDIVAKNIYEGRGKECHVTPDWLLIYSLSNDVLVLTLSRTGSHSDLF